ncbi:MAG: N-formylglutamate amidohydrolase, partial [Acidovorax sp.]|nr:N-formylglutamate amidohydrolase [Acidovorax sp.]
MHSALKLIHHRFQHAQPGATGSPGQAMQPSATVTAVSGSTPLVLDSPHSGTQYPADFGSALALATLRRAEDTHVEKIYAFAPALGVAWVEAHFPRIYLDANRDTTELDTSLIDGEWTDPISTDPKVLSKVRLGKGLIWKFTDEGEPIYHRQLTVAEVRARIDQCWRPYHAAVAQAIDAAHARHGYSIHLNC